MANQIVVSAGAKVRNLDGVLTATSGVVSSVPLGAANGVATLDSGGKVPVSQLPSSVVTYLGTWNATTNTPTLTNGVGDAGDMYICNVAGTVNFGAGPITFAVGDWVLYGSGTWQKSSGQNGTVTSVGASITGDAVGLTGSPITTAGTLAFAFAGTNLQYVNGAGNLTTFPTLITSIGLSMPSAFSVANSPLTANGTIAVTGAGTTAQYIRGDGSLATFPTIATEAQRLITEVYNETGATLSKGTVVYINGGHGNLPTITKALATGDATSAQTYGIVQTDITNMNNGYVVVIGSLTDLDTSAYVEGTQLYLSSTTAGAWTSVKQYAPAHLVYVAIVTRSHPTQGVVEVRIQNGFEMDELHNVSAQSPLNNQGLFYNTSTSLWENKSIATALGYTPANDASVVHLAGTETITGIKTFSNGLNTDYIGITGDMTMDGSFLLKHVAYGTLQSGYTNLSGQTNGLRVGLFGGYNALLNFSTSGSYTYTFPNATGTIALTSDIPSLAGYVTLATTQTITGAKTFNSGTKFDLGLFLKESSSSGRLSGYVGISATATGGMQQLQFLYPVSGSSVFSLPTTGSFNYEFPAASGTVALLEFSQTFSGLQSFTNTAGTDLTYGAYLTKNSIPSAFSSSTVNLYSASGNNNLVIRDNGNTSKLQFQATSSYTYTFPASTGTLALTTDIPSITGLVPYTGATTDVTLGNFSITGNVSTFKNSYIDGSASTNGQLMIKQAVLGSTNYAGYTSFYSTGTNISLLSDAGSSNYKSAVLSLSSLTNNTQRIYTLPNASGTLALTSDLTGGTVTSVAALTIGTSGTDLSSSVANSTTTPVITLNVPTASATNRGALSSADWTTFNNKQNALTNPVTGTGTTNYLPKFTGTSTIGNSAITDNGSTVGIGLASTFSSTVTLTTSDSRLLGGNAAGRLIVSNSDTSTYLALYGSSNGNSIGLITNSYISFNTGASYLERMRLDTSGNLGLGVTPSAWNSGYKAIQNNSTSWFSTISRDANFGTNVFVNSGGNYAYIETAVASLYTQFNGVHIWQTAPSGTAGNAITFTQAMTLFSDGNLALNTTTNSGYKLDVNGTGRFSGAVTISGNLNLQGAVTRNINFLDSSNTNINAQIQYDQISSNSGQLFFGTNNAGSFATRLTIASTGAATFSSSVTATGGLISNGGAIGYGGGELGFGVTTSGATSGIYTLATGSPVLYFDHRATGNTGFWVWRSGTGGGTTALTLSNTGAATFSSSVTAGGLVTINKQNEGLILTAGANTDASYMSTRANNGTGWLIMGSQGSVANYIQTGTGANESAITTVGAYALAFGTNQTERMRITSGGYLKASNTGTYFNATGSYHEFRSDTYNTVATVITNTNTTLPYGLYISFPNASPNNTTNYFLTCLDSTNDKFLIYSNGSAYNRTGTYGTISDISLKENIVDATPKLADLLQLKVRNFNMIGDETKQIGFIAQEFEEIFPSMVDIDGKSGKKAIKTSVLTPMIVKGMQEMVIKYDTKIELLEAQIEQLKAQLK